MKRNYICPTLEIHEVEIEKGFALSIGVGITDYSKNEDDMLDD